MSGADRSSAASPALHLRQICLVAADMPAVRADLETVFATPVCHIDPGVAKFGLENILIAFGSQFLEVVAPIREGTAAPQAAGVIHGDFERGFIRAETIAYDDYIACNGETGAKEAGKMRVEGKGYTVKDGDVLHFLFNA